MVMSVIEEISRMSSNGCDDDALMDYIQKNLDALECELNGEEYKEPKKRIRNLCIDCNMEMKIDYQKSTLVCTKCGLCEYYPLYVASYNHTIQPLRRKCVSKRLDNFKVFKSVLLWRKAVCSGPEIRDEIHDETNILCNYTIPITIPILECILKKNELMIYKGSVYYIYFKLRGKFFPHITTKEYNTILNVFNIVSIIYDKYKLKGRKSLLIYHLVLKRILIILGKVEYAKYLPPLKTRSKLNELERVWELITNDSEWAVALQKQKIVQGHHLNSTMLVDAFEHIYF